MRQSRRDLLRYGACGLLGRAAFMSGFANSPYAVSTAAVEMFGRASPSRVRR